MVWFGVFDGCYIVLLGVLCADIVGVNNVASGIGIQFFFMAITSFAGPPLAGLTLISTWLILIGWLYGEFKSHILF